MNHMGFPHHYDPHVDVLGHVASEPATSDIVNGPTEHISIETVPL